MIFNVGDKVKLLGEGTICRVLEIIPSGPLVFYRVMNLETFADMPLLHQDAVRPVTATDLEGKLLSNG